MIIYPAAGFGRALPPYRIEDVFRVVTATGVNLQAAINATGLDADLIIAKNVEAASDWVWRNTATGLGQALASNTNGGLSAFSGYSGSQQHVAYCFKRQRDFFDLLTWAGDGVQGRQIGHALRSPPGWTMTKCTSHSGGWLAMCIGSLEYYILAGYTGSILAPNVTGFSAHPTASVISIGNSDPINGAGRDYVGFLFGHNPGGWGVIQSGRTMTISPTQLTIPHGWKEGVQFVMLRSVAGDVFGTTEFFEIFDRERSPGWVTDRKVQLGFSAAQAVQTRVEEEEGLLRLTNLTGTFATRVYDYMIIRAAA